jgi:predicted thioesterase
VEFEARDSHELVARGKHIRAVIQIDRFMERLKKKMK